uniref:CRAL-TRIO domain-containing protein n=1 Tax=Craspedostauros australis TaxID=1486917 RepID=A0A7R9ZJT1_9STRA|mmetsp:Transcript_16004/g.44299  ORF Transcript_16004/g.44299 Transcript_16004/m.44299 type:complete len:393 (+) Transcript_16004:293-1471(+)|eukprot:CAMPEP_0198134364 /NCGR_PEP_ID=MMETSP1442-20131203/60040_1 /TAXON_ID= /ORGANISM="Craspedostauros australis, Strain CCMP3328" /LENGTH=392 /DNA_ID=CAMNT_0043795507 /DNA_START=241 /DNA_END=1419 /DNA_ORIENTATION=+
MINSNNNSSMPVDINDGADTSVSSTTSSSSSASESTYNKLSAPSSTQDHLTVEDIAKRILCFPTQARTSRELRALPTSQREKVWADMTGDPLLSNYAPMVETPEFISRCLSKLEAEIAAIVDKPAYDKACKQDPGYLRHPQFRLMFLRADEYKIDAAAARMVHHFNAKLELFGEAALTRDIDIHDFDEDDLQSLRAGGIQILPDPDRAGRPIIFTCNTCFRYKEHSNMLRTMWYTLMTAMEQEDGQRLGIVDVSYHIGQRHSSYDCELRRQLIAMTKCIPVRFVSTYICFSSSVWLPIADLISHMVSPTLRMRLRTIHGSPQEVLYSLMALGIPRLSLPFADDGEISLDDHKVWIEEQLRGDDFFDDCHPGEYALTDSMGMHLQMDAKMDCQ